MLDNSGLSVSNYDSLLFMLDQNYRSKNLTLGADNLEYCNADSARTLLINSGWTFNGDSLNCQPVGLDPRVSKVETEFTVYPNPSNAVLNIESNENLVGELIQVYNMQGQVILEKTIESTNSKLETAGLKAGVYLI